MKIIVAVLVAAGVIGYIVSRMMGKDPAGQIQNIAEDAWNKADVSGTTEHLKDVAREKIPEMRETASDMLDKTTSTLSKD